MHKQCLATSHYPVSQERASRSRLRCGTDNHRFTRMCKSQQTAPTGVARYVRDSLLCDVYLMRKDVAAPVQSLGTVSIVNPRTFSSCG